MKDFFRFTMRVVAGWVARVLAALAALFILTPIVFPPHSFPVLLLCIVWGVVLAIISLPLYRYSRDW